MEGMLKAWLSNFPDAISQNKNTLLAEEPKLSFLIQKKVSHE